MEAEQQGKAAVQQEKAECREQEERQTGRKKRGRKPKAAKSEPDPEPKINITNAESRILKGRQGFLRGYNAQAVVSRNQIILAADVVQDANDQKQLLPMVKQAAFQALPERPQVLQEASKWPRGRRWIGSGTRALPGPGSG